MPARSRVTLPPDRGEEQPPSAVPKRTYTWNAPRPGRADAAGRPSRGGWAARRASGPCGGRRSENPASPVFRRPSRWTIKGMSHQGDRRTGTSAQEDAWWGRSGVRDREDAGPAPGAGDSLDDRSPRPPGRSGPSRDSRPRRPAIRTGSNCRARGQAERPGRLAGPGPGQHVRGTGAPGHLRGGPRGGRWKRQAAVASPDTPDLARPEPPGAQRARSPGRAPLGRGPWSPATTSPPPASAAVPDPRTAPDPGTGRLPDAAASAPGAPPAATAVTPCRPASMRPPTAPAPFTDGCPDSDPAPPAPGPAPARPRRPRSQSCRPRRNASRTAGTAAGNAPPAPAPAPPAGGAAGAGRVRGAARPRAGLVPEPPYVGDGPPTYDAEPDRAARRRPRRPRRPGRRHRAGRRPVRRRCTLRAVVRARGLRALPGRAAPGRAAHRPLRHRASDALVLVAVASGARAARRTRTGPPPRRCGWIGRAVGRSHARLAERHPGGAGAATSSPGCTGSPTAASAGCGPAPRSWASNRRRTPPALRCLLLPADPECRTRVFFGVGDGGLFRLRDGDVAGPRAAGRRRHRRGGRRLRLAAAETPGRATGSPWTWASPTPPAPTNRRAPSRRPRTLPLPCLRRPPG